ncbi:hypothetical protein [Thalassovita mangrovi]|uniref:Oxidoreductase molybdopterin-binding domain-containing protein n=1 Tax=Thalassovita mangrovi TaxID=2692236 RepID=A0A6L8LJE8_9RHOB|nr:hypothetical protein [Thalassovita mangrovi]MYM56191.1 hypothetical protein [Thalassovita mangrovi]
MCKSTSALLRILALLVAAMFATVTAAAEDGSRIIRLSGALADGQAAAVTVKDLETAGLQEFTVFNPFEQREDLYTGVFIKDLVHRFGAEDVQSITLTAIDQYSITFDREEWENFRILISTRVNGDYFGFDKKGPLRVVFPDYDPNQLAYQEILSKWIWMITRIEFKK